MLFPLRWLRKAETSAECQARDSQTIALRAKYHLAAKQSKPKPIEPLKTADPQHYGTCFPTPQGGIQYFELPS
jgi:hypothetical protein